MQVILLERVEKLGKIGDIVTVKPGFARNYLLPQKKAQPANAEAIKRFEASKARLIEENAKRVSQAESLAKTMANVSVIVIRQAGESGQLFGSVTARDIAANLTEQGYQVDRTQVIIPTPIKNLGISTAKLMLHPEVSLNITINVAKSEDEAKAQMDAAKAAATPKKSKAAPVLSVVESDDTAEDSAA